MLVGQITALTAVMWWYGLEFAQLPNLASDGVFVILIVCISTPVQVLLLALMARWRGADPTDYLGLTLPCKGDVVVGIIAVAVFVVLADGISWLLGRDIVTQFQLDTYRTASAAGWLPWLFLTVVVVAPIGEETLFRGFLFRGWHRSGSGRSRIENDQGKDIWPRHFCDASRARAAASRRAGVSRPGQGRDNCRPLRWSWRTSSKIKDWRCRRR